ncbi:3-hydroxyacyl-ACP dehydratase [Chitinophaga niabensis]|uniref:3-hydroxymyristoyl/3-hydroxydecanoyl-(Acyl carrier protein) dehydratase n=1 Tax=Chitinophaga niabensis TaxID=536979 RepID=A0A1N6GL09_9BACT|nr:3-hydroxyacyl-ACP dehydratase [Chitinophaga niabensis]SIO08213.1 3-hydroxymyristoyl/3-hydroxydecanoyl-(acyl carrier protein) dehydratase [Chitinophaga niabensis]
MINTGDITEYIPQRPPIVMISRLMEAGEKNIRTELDIAADNVFVEDGLFMAPGLVENIAQTAAARIGYLAKKHNVPVPLGFIGAIQNLHVIELPAAGTTVESEIVIEHEVFNATVIKGTVKQNGKLMAECDMKIFVSQNK